MRSLRPLFSVVACMFMISTSVFAQSLYPEVVWAMPTSARIKCVSTVPGRMTVEYGTTSALGMTSPPEWRDWPNTDVTRHYVNLLGLQPNTTYYYRVRIAPQGGGSDLVSDVRTFKTFRRFSKILPTVRYSSYIIGSDWTTGDTNAPYHDWNAQHYDLDIAYAYQNAPLVKAVNPDAVLIRYDNITNNYAGIWREANMHWQDWCDQQGISYEHIAMHYAVDTEVGISPDVGDRKFDSIMLMLIVSGQWKPERLDYNSYRFPTQVGEFVVIGNALRFDVVYFTLKTPASGGYDGVWEYCNQVDANGKPVSWAPLTIIEDTTVVNGQKFGQSGYVRFIPPKERTEWKRSRIYYNGSDRDEYYHPLAWRRGFHIRFRVTQNGTAPTFNTMNDIQNEDFVKPGPNGKPVIPGWDVSWEANPANNGDPEYNPNPPTSGGLGVAKSARFKWWSRAWYYKPDILRFLCNVFDPYYVQWISGAWLEYIRNTNPGIEGWYCDNYTANTSPGTALTPSTTQFIEVGAYDKYEYTKGMGEVMEKASIKLTQMGMVSCANDLVNIATGDTWSNSFLGTQPDLLWVYFAPAIANREITMHYRQAYLGGSISSLNTFFAEMAYRVYARGQYHVPMYAYTIATAAATNTQDWWEREKMRALAQYLLVREPEGEKLFLNAWHQNFIYGEFLTDPSSSVNRYYVAGIPKQKAYYIDAATLDFGVPITTVSAPYTQWVAYPNSWFPGVIPGLFVIYYTDKAPRYDSQGNFLGNTGKTWYFARRYTKALVIIRTGESQVPEDERGMNDDTAFDLDGYYYRVRSDGSTDPVPINRMNLLKNEGAVLIPTTYTPAPQPNIQISVRVDKTNPKPLDVVTVTVEVRNTGSAEATSVRVVHHLPVNATFIQGSLTLNGITLPDPADRTRIEVTVPSIAASGIATLRFQMVIR